MPLFITPILPENNERPQKGTSIKKESDFKGSTSHGLMKERVTQVQGSETQRSQRPVRKSISSGNWG